MQTANHPASHARPLILAKISCPSYNKSEASTPSGINNTVDYRARHLVKSLEGSHAHHIPTVKARRDIDEQQQLRAAKYHRVTHLVVAI